MSVDTYYVQTITADLFYDWYNVRGVYSIKSNMTGLDFVVSLAIL